MACWTNRSITVGIPNCRTPPVGLAICTPLIGQGRVGPGYQLLDQLPFVLGQPGAQFVNGHPVDPRRPFVGFHTLVGSVQIRWKDNPFHQVLRQGALLVHRRKRLLLLVRFRSASGFSKIDEAYNRSNLFEQAQLFHYTLLPLYVHRDDFRLLLGLKDSALRHFVYYGLC